MPRRHGLAPLRFALAQAAVLVLALGPWLLGSSARADEPPERAAGPSNLPRPPAHDAGAPCTCSEQCAERDGYGTVCANGACEPYVDRRTLLTLVGMADRPDPPPFHLLPAVFPAIGYTPALGVLLGVSGTLGMFLGDSDDTTISNLQGVVLVTTKQQLIFQIASTVLTAGNDWAAQVDWRFLIFNQGTYGLGTGPWGGTESWAMGFDQLRFHQTVYRRVVGHLYGGVGYAFDRYFAVKDEDLDLAASPARVSPAHAYALAFGFEPGAYNVSGPVLAAMFDSRDSTINPYRGLYANVSLGWNPTWLGSSRDSATLQAEFRAYVGMDVVVPRNVLAFWAYYRGVLGGELPYLALPAIGWDARNRTGRGYLQGRFRGPHEAYGEVEWRFRLTNDGFLGGVLFANVQSFSAPAIAVSGPGWSFSQPEQRLLQYLQPAGGCGLRFMMNAQSRAAVTLDVGFGNGFWGIWLNAGEYF